MAIKKTPNSKKKSLAVMTGGGDCPGLNAAIRAVVKKAAQLSFEVFGVREGFRGLYEGWFQKLTPLDVSGIVSLGGTILGTSRFNPLLSSDGPVKIKQNLLRHGIDCLINIGGEGTMRFSYELQRLKMAVIGIPKTIDNDVWGTDFTFGFDTAVHIATEAIDRLHTTAEAHNRVMLVEVMGRHTGWIATHAGIAGGADAILIPEQVFSLARLLRLIEGRKKKGKKFSIVVVAEDAKILLDVGRGKSKLMQVPTHHDEYGKVQLGGIVSMLEQTLRSHLDLEVRSTVLGYVQRGGTPTAHDRVLASRLGVKAVEWASVRKTGIMVGLRGNLLRAVPLKEVAKKIKTVDLETYRVGEVFFG